MNKKLMLILALLIALPLVTVLAKPIPNGSWIGDWFVEKYVNITYGIKTPLINVTTINIGTLNDVILTSANNGTLLINGNVQIGPPGPQGPQGIQGLQGLKGDNGTQGPQGIQGLQGIQGTPGLNGTNGSFVNGTSAEINRLYVNGIYLDITNKDVQLYRSGANTLSLGSDDTFSNTTFSGNISFTSTQKVDGVDISALILKTTKITDLGNIWDKSVKIVYADTSITKSDLGLSSVENTALSTWGGSANIINLGTIITGIWHGSSIGNSYLDLSALTQNIVTTGQLQLSTAGSSGGIVIGGDAQIYRSAANALSLGSGDSFGATTFSGNPTISNASPILYLVDTYTSRTTFFHLVDGAFYIDSNIADPVTFPNSDIRIENGHDFYMDSGLFTGETLFIDGATGTILWSGDTNLYRSVANELKTDDAFVALGYLSVGADVGGRNAGDIIARRSNITGAYYFAENLNAYLYWDGTDYYLGNAGSLTISGNRLNLPTTGSSGGILIGGDALLYRSAANMLKTDDQFIVGGSLTAPDVVISGQIWMQTSGNAFNAPNSVDGDYTAFKARDSDTDSLVEVARIAGASDPNFSFGAGANYVFYNSNKFYATKPLYLLMSEDMTATADFVTIGAYELSAGHRALDISSEETVTVAAAGASDAYLNVRINGVTYKLLLHS